LASNVLRIHSDTESFLALAATVIRFRLSGVMRTILSMVEPERDDKAEQAARNKENEQEAEQRLKLKRQEVLNQILAPNNVLGLLSLYVVFLGVVVAFGVFAFYTGHKFTQEITFVACIVLFLALPIGASWYLYPIFTKNGDLSKRLLDRITQSSVSKYLARLGDNRIFRFSNAAFYAFMISDAIYSFPRHPRFSLVIVVTYVALSIWSLIAWGSQALKRDIYGILSKVLEINADLHSIASAAFKVAMSAHEYIQNTEESHSEAHKNTAAAITAINDALQLVATTVVQPQVDTPSKGPEGEKAEGEKAEGNEEDNEP
jgi:hypothetical protein